MKKIYLTLIIISLIIDIFFVGHISVQAQTPNPPTVPGTASTTAIDQSIVSQIDAMHSTLKVPPSGLVALNGNGPKVGDGCGSIILSWNNDVASNKTNPHVKKVDYENCINELIARIGQTDEKGKPLTCGRPLQYIPLQRSSSSNQQPRCCINGTIVDATGQPLEPAGKTGDLPQGKCLTISSQDPCLAISNLLGSLHKSASTLVCGISQSFIDQEATLANADATGKTMFSNFVANGNTFVKEQTTIITDQLNKLAAIKEFGQCTGADSQKNEIESLLNKADSIRSPLSANKFSESKQAHKTVCTNIPTPFALSHNACVKAGDEPGDIIILFHTVNDVRQGLISNAFSIGDPLRILKTPLPDPDKFATILQGKRKQTYENAQQEIIQATQNTHIPVLDATNQITMIEQAIRSYPGNLRRFLELGADLHTAYCQAGIQYDVEGAEGFTRGGGSCQDAIGQYFAKTSTVEETIQYREKNLDDVKIRLAGSAAEFVTKDEKKNIVIPNIQTCTIEELEQYFGGKDKVTASIRASLEGLVRECQMYETLIKVAQEKYTAAKQGSGTQATTQNQQSGQKPPVPKSDAQILKEVEDQMIQRCQEQSCTEITSIGMCCTEGQRGANNGICYPSALIAPNGEFCAAGVTKEGTCVANHRGDMGIQCSPQQLLIGACSFRTYDALQIRASNKDPSPKIFIQDIILSLTSFIGVVATLSLMRSGFKAIMAGYDSGSEYQTAIRNAGYSVIGLLLAAFSYAIVRVIQYVAMAGG